MFMWSLFPYNKFVVFSAVGTTIHTSNNKEFLQRKTLNVVFVQPVIEVLELTF